MKKYEFLDHTADVKIKAYGADLEEAFSNAALATFAVMTDVDKVKAKKTKRVRLSASSKDALLYDFLGALLFMVDTESFLLGKVEELKIEKDGNTLIVSAVLLGDKADGYDVHTYIKAVTYNDMIIDEKKGKVTIQVVHDI